MRKKGLSSLVQNCVERRGWQCGGGGGVGCVRWWWQWRRPVFGFIVIVSAAIWPSSRSMGARRSLNNLWVQEAAESAAQLINPPLMVSEKQQKGYWSCLCVSESKRERMVVYIFVLAVVCACVWELNILICSHIKILFAHVFGHWAQRGCISVCRVRMAQWCATTFSENNRNEQERVNCKWTGHPKLTMHISPLTCSVFLLLVNDRC